MTLEDWLLLSAYRWPVESTPVLPSEPAEAEGGYEYVSACWADHCIADSTIPLGCAFGSTEMCSHGVEDDERPKENTGVSGESGTCAGAGSGPATGRSSARASVLTTGSGRGSSSGSGSCSCAGSARSASYVVAGASGAAEEAARRVRRALKAVLARLR